MKNSFMKMLFLFSTLIGLVILVVLLGTTLLDGWKYLTVDFLQTLVQVDHREQVLKVQYLVRYGSWHLLLRLLYFYQSELHFI